jgi:hypothetical protein
MSVTSAHLLPAAVLYATRAALSGMARYQYMRQWHALDRYATGTHSINVPWAHYPQPSKTHTIVTARGDQVL